MRALHYDNLPPELEAAVSNAENAALSPYAFRNADAVRRDPSHDVPTAIRPPFIRDIDKILHCPYFNRYADKTQVFSFYKNDDISRRGLHVQLVSRIARTIGRALGLNSELIEAIALGHDIGHPPFAHTGEKFISELYEAETGRTFHHNIQSVRVLDSIFPYNMTLQTLSGIAGHDGENEKPKYEPSVLPSFEAFDALIERTYTDSETLKQIAPSTLEGCVVRISDLIAYLGKDRQDALRAKQVTEDDFTDNVIGITNAEIINNIVVNLIENSFGKPYVTLDDAHFSALADIKRENYEKIYLNPAKDAKMRETVYPMMEKLFCKLRADLIAGRKESPIFRHHIDFVNKAHYKRTVLYEDTEPNQLVIDYLASMTDDYFVDCFDYLFPHGTEKVDYKGYFN